MELEQKLRFDQVRNPDHLLHEYLDFDISTDTAKETEENIVEDPNPDMDEEGPVAISEILAAKGLTSRQQALLLRGTWMTGLNTALPIKDMPDAQLLSLIKAHTEQTDGTSPEKYYELKLAAMLRGLI